MSYGDTEQMTLDIKEKGNEVLTSFHFCIRQIDEPPHDKTNKMTFATESSMGAHVILFVLS